VLVPITPERSLAECETVIARGLGVFVEVGEALREIRDQRLYRSTHARFDDYCRERWGLDRTYAHRHIRAAEVVGVLPIGNTPQSESVARELVPLRGEPDRLGRVWADVTVEHGSRPTAEQVRRAVQAERCPAPEAGRIEADSGGLRLAYADPPYLGLGKYYPEHPEARKWDDPKAHRELIERLVRDYPDGWALSLHSPSLRTILPMCPKGTRVGAWVKPWCGLKPGVRPQYAWEPLVYWGGRNPRRFPHDNRGTPKDFLSKPSTHNKGLVGAKPEAFCHWVLDLLGFQLGDAVDDLFPGTGVMGRVAAAR
jgi:hypothetical protein